MKTFGQSEETYRFLVEGMPGMIWLARADGFMEYFNPHALDYLGLPAEELCGWGWRELVHPDDAPQAQAAWDRAVQSGTPYEAEYRMRRNDGTYRWQTVRGLPARGPDGQPQKWVGTCADIDDQKRAADERDVGVEAVAIQQNQARLQLAVQASERNRAEEDRAELAAIVESSDDAIIGKTLEGIITSWNEGARRLFGYTADEMLGQPVSRLIPADRPDEEPDILARLQRGERVKHFETVRRCKDGRLVDVSLSCSPIRDGTGRIVGASKIARDVSGRKRAEAVAEQANERLREQAAVLELAPVLVRDLESRIVLWTRGAERLYGFSKQEALGRVSHELFQTEFPESRAHVDERLRRAGQWEGTLVHRKCDGERLVVVSQQIVYHDGSGRPVRIMESNTDITERQRAEAELSLSQEQLRALAARLHEAREEEGMRIARELHDQLGRCLTMMKMDVGWMERELSSGDVTSEGDRALLEKVRGIGQAIDETVHIVRRISAELRPGVLDDLGLAAAIEWQAQDFEKRSGVACVLTLPEEDLLISRDQATALFRIFQESLTNVARHAQATKVWVHLGEENGAIVLEVEDDGVGISPSQLAERGSLGSLGLLGMRERATVFGGTVEIAGAAGQGTTVMARMPVLGNKR